MNLLDSIAWDAMERLQIKCGACKEYVPIGYLYKNASNKDILDCPCCAERTRFFTERVPENPSSPVGEIIWLDT